MKLVTFLKDGAEQLGAIAPDSRIADLTGAGSPILTSMQSLIEAGPEGLALAAQVAGKADTYDAADVRLLSPLPRPVQMRDFVGFETHMRNAGFSVAKLRALASADPQAAMAEVEKAGPPPIMPVWYEQPVYYKCNRFAVQGTGGDVHWPAYSRVIDYELEMAAIIGRQGRDIGCGEAGGYIFGYTIFNDLTARDAQAKEMGAPFGPAKGKDFDGANVLGPCIVTADEIGDPYDLTMIARVNGEEWSRGNTGSIHWPFEDMIAHVSQSETLYPGEVFGSGTVGFGCGLESMRFLKHGDVVELEIERIGVIRNRILAPHAV